MTCWSSALTDSFSELLAKLSEFRRLAHKFLTQVGTHFGVACSVGKYDELFSASRKQSTGVLHDGTQFRFHGAGCEIITGSIVLDFNVYPKVDCISMVHLSPYHFARFCDSSSDDVNVSLAWRFLEEAVELGHARRSGARPSYYYLLWTEISPKTSAGAGDRIQELSEDAGST